MNTDLMTKLQTLIYSNQDKLEQLVEALEGVCEKGCRVVVPEPKATPKHPLEGYTVSEKDIGSMFMVEGEYLDRLDGVSGDKASMKDCGAYFHEDIAPYTETIKLHFRPFYATKDSRMPSELVEGIWVALLFSDGDVVISEYPSAHYWKDDSDGSCDIVGYQILSFVNPVLGKE